MLIIIVNAIIAGLIASAGSIMAAAIEGGNVLPSKGAWIVAGCVFVMSAGKDWQSHVAIPPPNVVTAALAVLCLLLASGCSGLSILQNPATTTTQQQAIMAQQNARGCIYFKGNAQPWANVTTILVGTWGQDPPSYAECWQGLPAGIP